MVTTADGRLVWIIDGYTTSESHPYSRAVQMENLGRFNYIRNSIKATVDAYDGDVTGAERKRPGERRRSGEDPVAREQREPVVAREAGVTTQRVDERVVEPDGGDDDAGEAVARDHVGLPV